jgi:hypothetical protein
MQISSSRAVVANGARARFVVQGFSNLPFGVCPVTNGSYQAMELSIVRAAAPAIPPKRATNGPIDLG